jgi:hypothetical protein
LTSSSQRLRSLVWRRFGCLVVMGLAGCQTTPEDGLGSVVSIYATQAQAQAVGAGQFGAVPIMVAGEADIESVLAVSCTEAVAQVRANTGTQGWVPISALPARFGSALPCTVA